MKTLLSLLVLLWLAALPAVAAATDALNEALQRGLLAEEAQRDLPAAAVAYAEAVRAGDDLRAPMATALFRLAESQRRLGQTNEALGHYRRLLREFPDQTNLTSLALRFLPGTVQAASPNPRSEQEQLLVEEIKIAEMQEADVRKRSEAGRAGQDEMLKAQRDVLALKRQLAGLPRLQDVSVTPVAAGADPGGTHVPVDPFAEVDKPAAELAALDQLGDARERARFLAARHPLPELESIEQSLRVQPYVQPRTAEQEANSARMREQLELKTRIAIDSLTERLRFARLEADNLSKRQSARMGSGKIDLYGSGGLSGKFPIIDGRKLMLYEVIISARGKSDKEYADLKRVKVRRFDPVSKKDTVIEANVANIIEKGDRNADIELKDGDRVVVPARSIIF